MADAPWEPGPPSMRAMAPSIVAGALIPLSVYYAIRHQVANDAQALMIAGVLPAAWVTYEWVRNRRLEPIGAVVLFGFLVGVGVSELLGGNSFVLKVRDSVFTAVFGLVCLASLAARRPVMFYVGKALSAGDNEERQAAYDAMWELPTVPRVFAVITICWGIGLFLEAGARIVLAVVLPTGPFLAVSPALAAAVFGGLFAFTLSYSRRARRLGEAILSEEGLTFPSVPVVAKLADPG